MINKKKLLLISLLIGLPQAYGMKEPTISEESKQNKLDNSEVGLPQAYGMKEPTISEESKQNKLDNSEEVQGKSEISKENSNFEVELNKAEESYSQHLINLKKLDENGQDFDQNHKELESKLVALGHDKTKLEVLKLLQKNSDCDEKNQITLKERIKLFNKLNYRETQIRTNLILNYFAQKLNELLKSKGFAPINIPDFNQENQVLKWKKNTKKLIYFIIADWELITTKKINFYGVDDFNLFFKIKNTQLADIQLKIYRLKEIELAKFFENIDSSKKANEIISLLEEIGDYLNFLKKEFQKREKAINRELYRKNKNIRFTEDYNKKASIKTMHDYLNTVLVSSKRNTKIIDFIFQKIGRLTSEQCINGKNSYIEAVKPVREAGVLLSAIGLLNMGLYLRGHTFNGKKQSGLELGVYLKNKELKSATKYVFASLNKKHTFALLLQVGIGLGFYGHFKTDTLREKRNRFKNVITELEKSYQKESAQDVA